MTPRQKLMDHLEIAQRHRRLGPEAMLAVQSEAAAALLEFSGMMLRQEEPSAPEFALLVGKLLGATAYTLEFLRVVRKFVEDEYYPTNKGKIND